MTVLDRSELEASSLADLHLIADQIGLEGFRRLRKADLIDAILGEPAGAKPAGRGREKDRGKAEEDGGEAGETGEEEEGGEAAAGRRSRRGRPSRTRRTPERTEGAQRTERARRLEPAQRAEPEVCEGVVEILGNGSALVRVKPSGESDEDVYLSAAQVRRCELVSGDVVTGPVRAPRRSERHPSLIRVETINGAPAESVSEGTRYEELAVVYPSERIAFDSEDPTLDAIEWLTPIGRGSRASIVGASRSGKTEALRRIAASLSGREGVELVLVLAGARPEEISEWREGPLAPAAAVSFAASPDAQAQVVDAAIDTAKRLAARGGHAIVLIDSLDGLPPHSARKALAAARALKDGGSLTVIATASRPLGGESTVIALDALLAGTARFPALDLVHSGTMRPELLVGEDGAEAIAKARAAAAEG